VRCWPRSGLDLTTLHIDKSEMKGSQPSTSLNDLGATMIFVIDLGLVNGNVGQSLQRRPVARFQCGAA